MNYFPRYLRFRKNCIFLFVSFAMIFLLTFWLYDFPLASVIYPFLLCAVIGCAAIGLDFRKALRNHRILEKAVLSPAGAAELLPDPQEPNDEDWRSLIRSLCDEGTRSSAAARAGYNDMIDYYTAWAHQIKTPIASMRLRLEREDSELARCLNSDLRRIESYVGMVMAFLRLGSDSSDLVIREYDLDEMLRPVIRSFAGDFIGKKLALDYTPRQLNVLTDEKWFSFVIEQLLSNAIKYTNCGTISIFTENSTTLCIRDTGIGIEPEELPRIFEKGYTGLNGRRDMKASGLGLYLCKTICSRLGHEITVESCPGKGSIFRIMLGRRELFFE